MTRPVKVALVVVLALLGPAPSACYDGGVVGAKCGEGYSECNGQCVDLMVDSNNCGACGVVCPGGRACHRGMYCEGLGPGAGGEAGASGR